MISLPSYKTFPSKASLHRRYMDRPGKKRVPDCGVLKQRPVGRQRPSFKESFALLVLFLATARLSDAEPRDENQGGRRDVRSMITEEVLEEVFQSCETTLKDRQKLVTKLAEEGRVVKTSDRKADPSLNRARRSDPMAHVKEDCQLPFEEASHELYEKYKLTRDEIDQELPTVPLRGQRAETYRDTCTETVAPSDCDANARFRTANGQCNNLQNPTWGSATTCQQRLMGAYYVGNSGYRESVEGGPLPDPRTLSLNLHYHLNRPTNYVTHMYMFFGQFLDHDLTQTPFSVTIDNEAIQCCPPEEETHPQCRPILIRQDDPFYSQYNVTCLNFVRSVICPTCTMGSRQQMNQLTSFIDASHVYGNSDNETASLRTNDGTGRMRIQTSNNGDLLPASQDPQNDQCSFPDTNDICFQAGDVRANQHTTLASLHTIFVREHNRIAAELRRINPQWDDERNFQETRRIVGAQMQVITYKEYLPITVDNDRMSYFNLWIGESTNYDRREDPTMILEFTTAAFRFGHSMINSMIANSPRNASNQPRLLRDEFFQPFDLYNGVMGPLVRGVSNSPAQWFDRHLVEDVTNFLFRPRGQPTGLDLASANINRGRDHGMPPYVDMVRYCSEGQIVVRTFDDLVRSGLMESDQANALRRNYRNVNDVDLWTGILMERQNEGSVVGPTAACIIGIQFHKLKFGDRFYFEHQNQAGSFTNRQKQELCKETLSKIMCRNTDATQFPRNAMLFASRNNPTIYCSNVRGMDLSYWRE